MREFVRYIAGFSLGVLSAAALILTGLAVTLLFAPHLLLQVFYYGVTFLCAAAALIIFCSLLRAVWRRG